MDEHEAPVAEQMKSLKLTVVYERRDAVAPERRDMLRSGDNVRRLGSIAPGRGALDGNDLVLW